MAQGENGPRVRLRVGALVATMTQHEMIMNPPPSASPELHALSRRSDTMLTAGVCVGSNRLKPHVDVDHDDTGHSQHPLMGGAQPSPGSGRAGRFTVCTRPLTVGHRLPAVLISPAPS